MDQATLTVGPDYNLTPSVDLNVNIESAAVLHDISVKGLVQGAINDQINKSKATIGAAIGNVVDLRKHAQSAWSAIPGSVCYSRNKRYMDNDQSSGCDARRAPRYR